MTVIAGCCARPPQSKQAAVTMAELCGGQVRRFERTAPGFQGAVLLREGANLLAISCWDGQAPAEAALAPLLDRVASSSLEALLAEELAADAAALDAAAFRSRYRLP